ncbi:hypothetical protein [Allorhodopirellula heiligendammensis]|uniref:Cytochrome c domain-containing protein n=1 Tax=Allorhodopirellula heiligendammensis TaxID=2714739 RepID=A0A5C6BSJ9_9BACT|nr:hypothetical protein [Allorhodopirellula heiligendammensis]TWU15213.1 hypothetical protein Poly21_24070 [Allorhodopirellula heiligendammensis]
MKRLALMFGLVALFATPSFAISEFGKQFKEQVMESDAPDEFKKAVKKANCYICHVKGEKKEEVRNEYGKAIKKYLSAEDFPKEYIKSNPEEAKAKILAGFKKANEAKSTDGRTFEAKIKAHELPATDAGI